MVTWVSSPSHDDYSSVWTAWHVFTFTFGGNWGCQRNINFTLLFLLGSTLCPWGSLLGRTEMSSSLSAFQADHMDLEGAQTHVSLKENRIQVWWQLSNHPWASWDPQQMAQVKNTEQQLELEVKYKSFRKRKWYRWCCNVARASHGLRFAFFFFICLAKD